MTLKLKFEAVTDPEVIRFTHIENGSVWSSRFLSQEEYADREWVLGQSDLGQLHRSQEHIDKYDSNAVYLGLKYFVLKDVSLPETSKTSQIVASCETMNRTGWAMLPGDSTGQIHEVLVACIGGVFTLKHHRGRGYARRMIELLNEYYDSLAQNSEEPFLKHLAVHLYSEIGEYYAKNGYVSYHVPLYELHNLDGLQEHYCEKYSCDNETTITANDIRYLGYDDYEDLVELQKQHFKKQLLQAHDASGGSRFIFTVQPSLKIYKWFEDRDLFLYKKFREEKPTRFGAALADGSHIVWHHSWTSGTLILLKVQIMGEDQEKKLALLLKECIQEARSSDITHLEFWQDELPGEKFPIFHSTIRVLEPGSNLEKINSSLSAVRAAQGEFRGEILWLNNTKFCWF